jgi:hypothetical protein
VDPIGRQANEMESIPGTKVQMGEEKGMKYCECMMNKLESQYQNPDSASAMLLKNCLR